MPVAVTALYAGILAILVVALAINVTVHRAKLRIALGDGGNAVMLRMIRIHANAAEYVPLAIGLMLAYELNGGSHIALHVIGIALIAARILQSWNMWVTEVARFGRISGQTLTWPSIAVLAVLNLWRLM
jgi:uncharacterized membrane protein YecN with MAPEG domain